MKLLFLLLLIILGSVATGYGQVADSLLQTSQAPSTPSTFEEPFVDDTDDFTPMLGLFLLIGVAVALCWVGAGIVLIGGLLCLVFGLVATGILSASLLVSIKTNSVVAGAKTFWVLGSTVTSLLVGVVGLWMLVRVMHRAISTPVVLTVGGLGGVAAGLISAKLVWWLGRRLLDYVQRRLSSKFSTTNYH
ncbi:hypothetical protein [Hymenobacter sp. GOD-10R]|uniref:hypothetical protein n=1 Tax=Hymenobacter sp. GOD-10R TaxID=3093922 RepID=UPI002D790F6A|nr:hypothetical protein [Hymenobacter sp. GOD-10R]WRQ29766.1 hypothetical protein SD425_05745 [Hymenobacter sp. GOD-10R]